MVKDHKNNKNGFFLYKGDSCPYYFAKVCLGYEYNMFKITFKYVAGSNTTLFCIFFTLNEAISEDFIDFIMCVGILCMFCVVERVERMVLE